MKKIRQALRTFNSIHKETDAIYSELAKKTGLSDCAFWLMYSIREADEICTQKDFCGQWTMSKQTVNSALKTLEKKGYLALKSSETDKRSKNITLTDKGIEFASQHIDIVFKLEQCAFQRMSDAERVVLIESSRKYQELLREEVKHVFN